MNPNDYKISKYIYKYTTTQNNVKLELYKKKLSRYLNNNNNMRGGYDYTSPSDSLRYLECILTNSNCTSIETGQNMEQNINPYILVVYGPPASGKTTAKNLMINKFNLSDNYVDINVDKFVYDTDQFNDFIKTIDLTPVKTMSIDEIDLYDPVQKLNQNYQLIRSRTAPLLKILIGFAIMFKYNIVLETPGGGNEWKNIVEELLKHNYSAYIVYPYTNDINMLIDRSIKRGVTEYRFLTKQYMQNMVSRSIKNFYTFITDSNIMSKFKEIIAYDTSKIKLSDDSFDDVILFNYGDNTQDKLNNDFVNKLKSIIEPN